jgi:hypothetical protein
MRQPTIPLSTSGREPVLSGQVLATVGIDEPTFSWVEYNLSVVIARLDRAIQ